MTEFHKAWDATSQACARQSAPHRVIATLGVAALRAHDMLLAFVVARTREG